MIRARRRPRIRGTAPQRPYRGRRRRADGVGTRLRESRPHAHHRLRVTRRAGRSRSLRPRGPTCGCSSSSLPSSRRVAVGVEAVAFARAERGLDRHLRISGCDGGARRRCRTRVPVSPRDRAGRRCRRGPASCSSWFAPLRVRGRGGSSAARSAAVHRCTARADQGWPCGSRPLPSPARTLVCVRMVVAQPPCGSRPLPSPARIEVWVVMACSFSRGRSGRRWGRAPSLRRRGSGWRCASDLSSLVGAWRASTRQRRTGGSRLPLQVERRGAAGG
jgi:hypothetical protein